MPVCLFTVDQERAISQHCWIELQNEKLARLREKLHLEMEKLQQSLNIILLKNIAFKLPSLNMPTL